MDSPSIKVCSTEAIWASHGTGWIKNLKEKAKFDDVNRALLAETARLEQEFPMQPIQPAHFEDLFEQRLMQYDDDEKFVETERSSQDRLVSRIQEANNAFVTARAGDTSSTRDREKALQKLETAFLKYKEIISNIDTGRKFYNDLAKIMTRFRDECKSFAYQRRLEANSLENDLDNAMSSLNLNQGKVLEEQKQRDALRTQYAAKPPPADPPLAAPVPQRANVQPPPTTLAPPTAGVWSPQCIIPLTHRRA